MARIKQLMASAKRNKQLRCAMGQRKGGPGWKGVAAPPKEKGTFPCPPFGSQVGGAGGVWAEGPPVLGEGRGNPVLSGDLGEIKQIRRGINDVFCFVIFSGNDPT